SQRHDTAEPDDDRQAHRVQRQNRSVGEDRRRLADPNRDRTVFDKLDEISHSRNSASSRSAECAPPKREHPWLSTRLDSNDVRAPLCCANRVTRFASGVGCYSMSPTHHKQHYPRTGDSFGCYVCVSETVARATREARTRFADTMTFRGAR